MNFLIKLVTPGIAVFIASYILPGVKVDGFLTALVAGILISAVNVFFKPILNLLTLPINVLTLGLFSLVINTILIMLVDYLVPGMTIANFWWALVFGIVLSLISSFLNSLSS